MDTLESEVTPARPRPSIESLARVNSYLPLTPESGKALSLRLLQLPPEDIHWYLQSLIDVTFRSTKVISLEGLSGSGKTSLQYALGDYIRKTHGVDPVLTKFGGYVDPLEAEAYGLLKPPLNGFFYSQLEELNNHKSFHAGEKSREILQQLLLFHLMSFEPGGQNPPIIGVRGPVARILALSKNPEDLSEEGAKPFKFKFRHPYVETAAISFEGEDIPDPSIVTMPIPHANICILKAPESLRTRLEKQESRIHEAEQRLDSAMRNNLDYFKLITHLNNYDPKHFILFSPEVTLDASLHSLVKKLTQLKVI